MSADNPTAEAGCPEPVWQGGIWDRNSGYQPCGKPIKRDGLCGIHARKADNERKRKADMDAMRSGADEARDLAERLSRLAGVRFIGLGRDRIEIDNDNAKRLIELLEAVSS